MSNEQEEKEPNSYKKVVQSADKGKWLEAIRIELNLPIKNETWEIVDKSTLLKATKIISSHWVEKIKIESNGTKRYKSRLIRSCADKNNYDLRLMLRTSTFMTLGYCCALEQI